MFPFSVTVEAVLLPSVMPDGNGPTMAEHDILSNPLYAEKGIVKSISSNTTPSFVQGIICDSFSTTTFNAPTPCKPGVPCLEVFQTISLKNTRPSILIGTRI